MKPLLIVLSLFLSLNLMASTWMAGNEKYQLHTQGDDGWVSHSCLKDCELKEKIQLSIKDLSSVDTSNGKDPASGLCKKAQGKVIYLAQGNEQEAFCVLGTDIISLSLVLRD